MSGRRRWGCGEGRWKGAPAGWWIYTAPCIPGELHWHDNQVQQLEANDTVVARRSEKEQNRGDGHGRRR